MRKEIENWWEQAKIDLKNAEVNLNQNIYYVCVFLCQQAVEKGLKSYFMIQRGESPGTTHSLIYLATSCHVPQEHIDFLVKLTPEFIATRYPDVADEIPARLYTEKTAQDILNQSKRVFVWLEKQIKKH